MKIGVKKSFKDKEEKVLRKPGDIIEVSDERGDYLVAEGYANYMQDGGEAKAEMPKKKYKRGSNHN